MAKETILWHVKWYGINEKNAKQAHECVLCAKRRESRAKKEMKKRTTRTERVLRANGDVKRGKSSIKLAMRMTRCW